MKRWLKENGLYALIGIVVASKGFIFLTEPHFFIWPPNFTYVLNDQRLDFFGIAAGFCLFAYAVMSASKKKLLGVLLGLCIAFISLITVIELCHIVFAGQYELKQAVTGNIFIIAVILYASYVD